MIRELIEVGFFRPIVTEGRQTYILETPLNVVITGSVLNELRRIYRIDSETGGFLFAFPDAGRKLLIVRQVVEIANQLPKSSGGNLAYSPNGERYRATIQDCLRQGGLPIRWHSHPVQSGNTLYDLQSLNFFQKTSDTDRHNSYLPLPIEGYNVVLPDGLLSADDRSGTDVRFYLYNGFISPISRAALLVSQKIFLFGAGGLFLVLLALKRLGFGAVKWFVLLGALVYLNEERKRPDYVDQADGSLLISFN